MALLVRNNQSVKLGVGYWHKLACSQMQEVSGLEAEQSERSKHDGDDEDDSKEGDADQVDEVRIAAYDV